jgi:NADPH:quinone reductase-like Zn-dependent oxidoreductase
MSRTISYTRFGGPEVLTLRTLSEVGLPQPGPGQLRIRVRAAGINPLDAKVRRGELVGQFPSQFPITPGLDVAGVVDTVGDGVTDIGIGDEVFGIASGGSYADHALAQVGSVHPKPASIGWELAAALPTVGEAALRALNHLDLHPGETLLIHGGAGSVGFVATQLAVTRGITVLGSAAAPDAKLVSSLGGIPVTYGPELPDRVRALFPAGVDAVLDTTGAGVLPESIELAGGPQRVITLADAAARSLGVRFTGADPADRYPNALSELAALAAAGTLALPIWRTYPLTDAATAHTDLEARRNHGKMVLLP